jgi:hypothetical protein
MNLYTHRILAVRYACDSLLGGLWWSYRLKWTKWGEFRGLKSKKVVVESSFSSLKLSASRRGFPPTLAAQSTPSLFTSEPLLLSIGSTLEFNEDF